MNENSLAQGLITKQYEELTNEEKKIVKCDIADRCDQFDAYLLENKVADKEFHSAWMRFLGESLLAKVLLNTPEHIRDENFQRSLKEDIAKRKERQ